MASMFSNAYNFNGDVSTWDVSNVTDFGSMFYGCELFDQDLSSWDTRRAEYMYSMYNYASRFRGVGLEYWITSKVNSMNSMFRETKAFDRNLSGWDVSNVRDMASMVRYSLNELICFLMFRRVAFCMMKNLTLPDTYNSLLEP
jgi:surface protein